MSIRTPKFIALVLTLFAGTALLAFAACGGGDDNASNTATGAAHNTATAKPGADTTKTEEATATPEGTGSANDVLSELQSFGNDIQQVTGKVTYTSTDTAAGETPKASTFTYYSKDKNSRLDTVDSDGSTTALISTPDITYVCTSSDQTCIAETGAGASLGGLGVFGGVFSGAYIDALISAAEAQGIDVGKSSENIAGTDATCFSGNDNGDIGKFCFSGDGLMLLSDNTSADGSSSRIEATSFSSDVSDSDFEPLYPVTTTIDIPGQ
jgi:hypothetical protein